MAINFSVDDLRTAAWIYDFDNFKIHTANASALTMWESPSLDELTARNFKSETSDAVREGLQNYKQRLAQGEMIVTSWRIHPKGVNKDIFAVISSCLIDGEREAMLVECTPHEVSKEHAVYGSCVSMATFTTAGCFVSGNPPFHDEMGDDVDDFDKLLVDQVRDGHLFEEICAAGHFERDILLNSSNGQRWFRTLAESTVSYSKEPVILMQLYDIHERKIREISLAKQVNIDPLTGLLSRRGLIQRFASVNDIQKALVLFYINLDGFKFINDTYGHDVGDQLLIAVAKRLTEGELACGVAGRIGGDEFIWTALREHLPCELEKLGQILVKTITSRYLSDNCMPLSISASVGVADNSKGESIETILVHADTAMYHAKQAGRRRFTCYMEGMETALKRRSLLVQHLHKAIEQKELSLYYQPIIDNRTGTISSFEALMRWQCSDLGAITAEETIRIAEETGLIDEVEDWAIEQALSDLKDLRRICASNVSVSVNISGLHLGNAGFSDTLLNYLNKYGFSPSDLCIELTESTLLKHLETPDNPVHWLSNLGFPISIDDFGTGFSSLAYLHNIPATYVKIDQSFVKRMPDSNTTLAYMHQLINSLGKMTIVEGVETEAQRNKLAELGMHLHQGFLHAHPACIADILSRKIWSYRPETGKF